ncbi:hypothetical protein VMCG_05350 [Cytospora schulzeri]|uniref:Uncharacterized protein n=1 Tax=Cytospora schulzeri TaxID=448051 RepID=A0A423WJS6_9PEZI|nr:hypothetical protein VMCG_05350 [Valsa malicola]
MKGLKKTSLIVLVAAIQPVWSSFSLNLSGPDWDYTAKDLANTTSEACRTAYSAQIDCDDTLLGYVASMRPAFDPTSNDLDRTCTTTCSDSLASYVQNVIDVCDQPGDLANEAAGSKSVEAKDPVALVGQIFQYTFAQNCKKDDTGYCTLQDGSIGDADDFSCDDKCTLMFYTNAHNYAASGWLFSYYYLVGESSWWEEEYSKGWKTAKSCGAKENLHPIASLPDGDVASSGIVGATGTTSASSTAETSGGSTSTPSLTATATSTTSPTSQSAPQTSTTATAATSSVSANEGVSKVASAGFAILACSLSLTWV